MKLLNIYDLFVQFAPFIEVTETWGPMARPIPPYTGSNVFYDHYDGVFDWGIYLDSDNSVLVMGTHKDGDFKSHSYYLEYLVI